MYKMVCFRVNTFLLNFMQLFVGPYGLLGPTPHFSTDDLLEHFCLFSCHILHCLKYAFQGLISIICDNNCSTSINSHQIMWEYFLMKSHTAPQWHSLQQYGNLYFENNNTISQILKHTQSYHWQQWQRPLCIFVNYRTMIMITLCLVTHKHTAKGCMTCNPCISWLTESRGRSSGWLWTGQLQTGSMWGQVTKRVSATPQHAN